MNIFSKIFGSKSSEPSTTAVTTNVPRNNQFRVHFEDRIAIEDEWISFAGIPAIGKKDGKTEYYIFSIYLRIPIESLSETRHMIHNLVMENEAVRFDITYEMLDSNGYGFDKFVLKDCYVDEVYEDSLRTEDDDLHEMNVRIKCSDICY